MRHPALRMLGNALFIFVVAQVDVSDHAAFAELALARLALYCGRLLEAVDADGFGNMLGVFGVRVERKRAVLARGRSLFRTPLTDPSCSVLAAYAAVDAGCHCRSGSKRFVDEGQVKRWAQQAYSKAALAAKMIEHDSCRDVVWTGPVLTT